MRRNMKPMNKERGFSMMEVLTVCAIIGVMTTMAVPSVMRSIRSQRLMSGAQQVAQALQSAKFEAIRTNNRAQIQLDPASNTLRLVTWSGSTSTSATAVALPPEVQFSDLPSTMTGPSVITSAASNAGSITGQESNSRKAVSFPLSSSIRIATFTTRGLPGNTDGTNVYPGLVNWVYLTNSLGERMVVTITSAGSVQTWRWNASSSQWVN